MALSVEEIMAVFVAIRERRVRVHCVTNAAAQVYTANLLLAVGAIPSLTLAKGEVPSFTKSADALLINLGTFDAERRNAFEAALGVVDEMDKPWILDPVFIERSPLRCEYAKMLLARSPTATRMNAAEFQALTGCPSSSYEALSRFSADQNVAVALSGPEDRIYGDGQMISLSNGHPFMAAVTAMGCSLTAVAAAALTVCEKPSVALASVFAAAGVAGEIAAEKSSGPGSFAMHFLDGMHAISQEDLDQRLKMKMGNGHHGS